MLHWIQSSVCWAAKPGTGCLIHASKISGADVRSPIAGPLAFLREKRIKVLFPQGDPQLLPGSCGIQHSSFWHHWDFGTTTTWEWADHPLASKMLGDVLTNLHLMPYPCDGSCSDSPVWLESSIVTFPILRICQGMGWRKEKHLLEQMFSWLLYCSPYSCWGNTASSLAPLSN